MKHILLSFALVVGGAPALADTSMSAAEFEAYTTGKTLYFGLQGQPYGVEQYLPNRRVIWSFLDGNCQEGVWYPRDEFICFDYVDNPNPQCWTFFRVPNGLKAIFENEPTATTLYEATSNDEPMYCKGPEIGVSYPVEIERR